MPVSCSCQQRCGLALAAAACVHALCLLSTLGPQMCRFTIATEWALQQNGRCTDPQEMAVGPKEGCRHSFENLRFPVSLLWSAGMLTCSRRLAVPAHPHRLAVSTTSRPAHVSGNWLQEKACELSCTQRTFLCRLAIDQFLKALNSTQWPTPPRHPLIRQWPPP